MQKTRYDKIQLGISYFIIFTLIIALFIEFFNKRWLFFFVTCLSLILCLLPYIFQKKYKIYLPSEVQLAIVLFIYAGVFLGEVRNFYVLYWWWDSLLHLFSGFAMGLVAFGIMYVLYKTNKIKTSVLFIALLIFCLTISIGVIWEIFEFGMDSVFGLNMQRSRDHCLEPGPCDTRLGLMDTMYDFILNTIGALFASVIGFIYLKKEDHFILNNIIKKFTDKNPRLFNNN